MSSSPAHAFSFAAVIRVCCVCCVFVGAGCSSSTPAAGGDGGNGGGGCGSAPVSFRSDVMPIFPANCSSSTICHGQTGNSSAEDLYLGLGAGEGTDGPADIAAVYAGLVGVKSLEDPSMNLVTAGDLESSYLWHKISGDQNSDPTVTAGCAPAAAGANPCSDCVTGAPCGVQMPFAATLAPSAICTLQNWIQQGASDN